MSHSVTIGQKAIMPGSDKPIGQAVQQESSDELHGADGDRLGAVFLSVFGAKGYHAIVKRGDTAVCNSHPVGVSCQVLKDLFGLIDGIARTDHPFFCKKCVFEFFVPIGTKFRLLTFAKLTEALHELAAEDQ